MTAKDDAWRIWKSWPQYGELLYRRATGEEQEMESSKAICKILTPFYSPGMKLLDVGCGAGHYYLSLKKRLSPEIDYFGVDATEHYIELARKAYPGVDRFAVGDVFDLQFADGSFDVVLCSNVIVNLPPPPTRALRELIRVSKQYVVIRALFGERNYVIKELRTLEETGRAVVREKDLISPDGEIRSYHYNNMYTEAYFREVIQDIAPGIDVSIQEDRDWKEFDNRDLVGPTATRVFGDRQVSGNLLFDWRFIVLKK